jgi:hypothetical protein
MPAVQSTGKPFFLPVVANYKQDACHDKWNAQHCHYHQSGPHGMSSSEIKQKNKNAPCHSGNSQDYTTGQFPFPGYNKYYYQYKRGNEMY